MMTARITFADLVGGKQSRPVQDGQRQGRPGIIWELPMATYLVVVSSDRKMVAEAMNDLRVGTSWLATRSSFFDLCLNYFCMDCGRRIGPSWW